jgi:hypothetical protein
MAIMTAGNRATARDAAQRTNRADQQPIGKHAGSPGAMVQQSSRGYEAVPQAFVRLTGSHLARPRVSRKRVTE